MNKLLLASSAIVIAMTVSAAQAAEERWPRWYVGLSGGLNFLSDADVGGANTGNVDFDMGGVGTASLGYLPPSTMQPFSNMRIEAEFGYHYNSIDTVQLGAAASATSKGYAKMISYMGNAYYDFHNTSRMTPYIGAGAGVSQVTISKSSGLNLTGDNDTVFSYQLLAGIAYKPVTLPNTEWSLGYRYFTATDPKFQVAGGTLSVDDLTAHSAEIGARFRF